MPELQPGDVLLRVDAALLCGTDVRIYQGRKQRTSPSPLCWATNSPARWSTPTAHCPTGWPWAIRLRCTPCDLRRCVACRKGHENICKNRKAFGYQLTGGLSQYVRVPAVARQNLVPVPGVPAAEAAIIEPVACAYNGQKLAGMSRAQIALIVGCASRVVIVPWPGQELGRGPGRGGRSDRQAADDGHPFRGGSRFGTRSAGPPDQLNDFSNGGIDVLVMAIGPIDALTPYLGCLAPGASVSVFAGFGADADLPRASANDVHYNEWNIVGASSCRLDGFHAVAPMVASGTLPVAELIGTQLPLDRAVEGHHPRRLRR